MVATRFKKTQGGQTRRKGAQCQGKTGPQAGVLVPGERQEPQRCTEMGLLHQEQAAAKG
jgi:hypothetical protein